MEHLFVDIGNSCIKAAVQVDLQWNPVFNNKTGREELFYSWLDERTDSGIVVCSVVDRITQTLDSRYPEDRIRVLKYGDIPNEFIEYGTPRSLGMDRFFTCFGASGQTSRAVVVIDVGTACTVDYMTADGIFRGGAIMPGLQMMLEAASQIPSLPLPDEVLPSRWPGNTTLDSVRWGTTGAFLEAIKSFIGKYRAAFGEATVFATGGGASVISRYLGDEFEIRKRPNLLFEGLQAFVERFPREQ